MFASPSGRHAARTSLLSQITPPKLCRLVGVLTRAAFQY